MLCDADLTGADLRGCDLTGADRTGARLADAPRPVRAGILSRAHRSAETAG